MRARKDQFRDVLAQGMIVEIQEEVVNKSCILIGENAGNQGVFLPPQLRFGCW